MTNPPVIEVTQDGMVILDSKSLAVGVFTKDIETCCVYVFFCSNALAVLHDTGQLSIASIVAGLQPLGTIDRIRFALNPDKELKLQTAKHAERRAKMAQALGFKKNVKRLNASDGEMIVTREKKIFLSSDEILKLRSCITSAPGNEERAMTNVVNNLFSENNSQSIPVDIQYQNGAYTRPPKILKNTQELEARARSKLLQGDMDYQIILNKARQMGLTP